MSTPIKSSAQAPPDRFSGGADELTIRVRAVETDGALSAVETRMPSGGGPPVLHRHDSFEFYRVQRGELTSTSRTTAEPSADTSPGLERSSRYRAAGNTQSGGSQYTTRAHS
jgi:hypothetical protein